MHTYAQGELVFGLLSTDNKKIFEAIKEKIPENEEDYDFSGVHTDLCIKHKVELYTTCNGTIDVLSGCSFAISTETSDVLPVTAEGLTKTKEYEARINTFLEDLDIPDWVHPKWHLIVYKD